MASPALRQSHVLLGPRIATCPKCSNEQILICENCGKDGNWVEQRDYLLLNGYKKEAFLSYFCLTYLMQDLLLSL